MINCYIETNHEGAGIRFKSGTMRGHIVMGCDIWENGFQGIYAYGLTDSVFANNLLRRNSYKGTGNYSGILLDTCSRISTTGINSFNGAGAVRQSYGYVENGNTCTACIFTGNVSLATQHTAGAWHFGTGTVPTSPASSNVG